MFAHTRDNSLLNSAKSINSGISAAGQIQLNQKEFNSIFATYLEADSLVSGGQIQNLVNMAQLSPNTDGLAVYQSRGLIRNWDDSTEYFNECERILPELANPGAAQRLLNTAQNNPSLTRPLNVYPNPNNGKLTIENSPENSTFELYDIVGRKVYSNMVGNVTQLDLSPFNNGTYLYKVIKDNKVVKEEKLIINK